MEEDREEAFKWFKQAADLGHEDGCNAVALHYLERKLYKPAVEYFEEAARQGHPRALFNLAELYLKGLGVPAPSREKAIELFKTGHRELAHLPSKHRLLDLGVDPDEPMKPR